jgi:hypothetical protein
MQRSLLFDGIFAKRLPGMGSRFVFPIIPSGFLLQKMGFSIIMSALPLPASRLALKNTISAV